MIKSIFSVQQQLRTENTACRSVLVVLLLSLLSACNTEKSSSNVASTQALAGGNASPQAATDGNKTVRVGRAVTVDASSSQDPDGGQINYSWAFITKPSDSQSELAATNDPVASFTPDVPGDYQVEVEVTDEQGASDTESSTVAVSDNGPSTAVIDPTADAGLDQNVTTSTLVRLDGSNSSNGNGGLLDYQWRVINQPTSTNSALSSLTTVDPTFTPDVDGTYTFGLIVIEAGVSSTEDQIIVVSTTGNSAPVANTGSAQSVAVGDLVQLDGSNSSDADGDPLTYNWSFSSRPGSSNSALNNPTSPNPNFVADGAGQYTLALVVNDGAINSASHEVVITAQQNNSAPTAAVTNDFSIQTGTRATVTGAQSSDPDGDSLQYLWSLISKPTGSTANLSNSNTVSTNITPDTDGAYVLQLVVNDGTVASQPDRVTITSSTANSAPNANAGNDQSVATGDQVFLDGRSSSDPDSNPITYAWTMASRAAGSNATLSSTSSPSPTFVADRDGSYVVELRVNDGAASSSVDRVTVTATSTNSAPVANAGNNQSVELGAVVALDGSGSSDANGDQLTYQWTLSTKPAGSNRNLYRGNSVRPSLTPDVGGTYVARLVVSDGTASSNADTVNITVSTSNGAPTANAGPDQAVSTGASVALNANNSTDPDGDSIAYSWTTLARPAGSSATLSSAGSAQPRFTPDVAGTYRFRLTTSDSQGGSDTDDVTVTATSANTNSAPTAAAGNNQSVQVGNVVYLSGSGSTDADGDSLTYSWSFNSRPGGSSAVLSATNSAAPSFVADRAGTYNVRLVVNDGAVNSSADSVSVVAISGNNAPVAQAGANQNVNSGALVQLNGSSSSDADGDNLTYTWSLTSRPSGSSAALNNATNAQASFTADVDGSYVVRLVVNDGQTNSSADTLTVTATTPGGGGGGSGGGVSDTFDGTGPLIDYVTNNASALPNVARQNGRYRAVLTDNTNDKTLHFNNSQGRLDAKLVSFPFEYIVRNIGIGTQANSQQAPSAYGGPYMFAGIQVHVTNLSSRNSTHIVVGHRGNTGFTIEGKNTVNGSSSVNDDGANVLPTGRADIRIVGDSNRNLTIYWRQPNSSSNWRAYRGSGKLPGNAPSYGSQVYIGLITYGFRSSSVPFVGTADSIELVGE